MCAECSATPSVSLAFQFARMMALAPVSGASATTCFEVADETLKFGQFVCDVSVLFRLASELWVQYVLYQLGIGSNIPRFITSVILALRRVDLVAAHSVCTRL